MPKYSFTCQNCKEEFTVTCKYEEKWDSVCPHCGSKEKKRYLSLWDMVPLKAFWIVWESKSLLRENSPVEP